MNNIRTLIIFFDNELASREITLFRGAVNAALEEGHSMLFHNHTEDGLRYAYPLIQYKRINKRAAIVCIEDGTEAVGEYFNSEMHPLVIGERTVDFTIKSVKSGNTLVQLWQNTFKYHVRNWLPFNSSNYKAYSDLESIADKAALLERILIGNILSFLKGVGIFVEERIVCHIISINEPRAIHYKGVKLMSFDIDFMSNISLPPLIGLGKGSSVGFGMITKRNNKTSKIQDSNEKEQ